MEPASSGKQYRQSFSRGKSWSIPISQWLAQLSQEEFREIFRGSPVKRARFSGLRRNVAIAMANSGEERFLILLEELSQDEDAVVAEHARWGLRTSPRFAGRRPQQAGMTSLSVTSGAVHR